MAAASCRRALLMSNRFYGGANRVGLGLGLGSVPVCRAFSGVAKPNSRRLILVDTLALVRKLEANGVPTKQAEAITEAFKEVQNDNYDNVSHNFVSKVDMDKSVMTLQSYSSKLETQVTSNVNHHFSLLQQENEKLKTDIEKIRSELRYEIDKVTAGLRLDLNLEKGRIRDEMNNQNQETTNLNSKVDREIHVLRALIEALKYELIKYCLGTFASLSAVGLALLRILL
ncbi:hypothetical protein C2S51_036018 [Perilla frutescens var. frutescens]|nr:hypothetical protein C2S51_036018 [Perilla frutescens var. frutescens]